MEKKEILKTVLQRIEKVQESSVAREMEDTLSYRPANQAELALAMSHADRLGISVEGEIVADSAGWVIISYTDANEESAQMRLNPNEVQHASAPQITAPPDDTENFRYEEEVQIDEGKIKKGSTVIAKMGPHKGEKHQVIHVFPNGKLNIKPTAGKNKYRLGAAGAEVGQVTLVHEEIEDGKKPEDLDEKNARAGSNKAACPKCGGWTGSGGMSQYKDAKKKIQGRTGCTCNKSRRHSQSEENLNEVTTIPSTVFAVVSQTENDFRVGGSAYPTYPSVTDYTLKKFGKTMAMVNNVNTPQRQKMENDLESVLRKWFAKWDKYWTKEAIKIEKSRSILKKKDNRIKIGGERVLTPTDKRKRF